MVEIIVNIGVFLFGILIGFFSIRSYKQGDINLLKVQNDSLETRLILQESTNIGLENDLSNLGKAYEENIELTRDYRELASRTLVGVYRQLKRVEDDRNIWKRKYYDEIQTNLS
jgi:replication fork clamp-binding protein CrfC